MNKYYAEGVIPLSVSARLNKILDVSREIPMNDSSKIILMSDCHRGNGGWGDNFSNNQNLFFAALTYYYHKNFTYIELGDGEELWENRYLEQIITAHSDAYWLMSKFYKKGRLYMLYGNHDMVKKNTNYVTNKCSSFYDEYAKKKVPLFPCINITEGLILKYTVTGDKILLIHGHQGDFFNYTLWKLSRFLVRYLWGPLELIGLQNPTSAAKNYNKKNAVERKLMDWSVAHNLMLIAGHTHRPIFPKLGEPLYFNDGSCVHPRCITAIEIENGTITLVKWTLKTKKDRTLYVGRVLLAGPLKLQDIFKPNAN
jgi:UDP-2,3-diacylglucosamine pyrophosphatase LpxH